jgi:hypothetical protein
MRQLIGGNLLLTTDEEHGEAVRDLIEKALTSLAIAIGKKGADVRDVLVDAHRSEDPCETRQLPEPRRRG